MSPKEALKFTKDKKAVCVDLKFLDFLGIWQHFTVPMSEMKRRCSTRASASTGRRFAAGSRFTPRTCW